jgi:HIV-1 Vpr-binding protein
VAQTRIQYNEQQLHQLIYQHLLSKGLTESASILQKEANLESPTLAKPLTYQPFHYRSPVTTSVSIYISLENLSK